jgi:multidrug efflux system outer membrane protein
MRKTLLFTCLAAVSMTGCTMAPRYTRPEAPVSASFGKDEAVAANALRADETGWRDFYKDPHLQNLIQAALENNRDLRVTALKVEKMRAMYRIQRAALLPTVNATGALSRTRKADDLVSSTQDNISDEYSAKLGTASWEIDLWGRVRSLKNEALETYLASEETSRSVRISLVAEVARQYLTRLSLAENRRLAGDTLASVTRNRELVQRMRGIGKSSEMDMQTAEAQVAKAQGDVAAYERQLAAADNALFVLVGRPLSMEEVSGAPLGEIALTMEIAPGLPSDLLARRPDILAAEHTLKAANADIGAARAAFFPKIALTGSVGTASDELSGLFDSGNSTWNFAPSITMPIFAGGAVKSAYDVARIAERIEIANYEKAIQTAFKEVADTLAANEPLERELLADTALVAAQAKRLELAEARYKAGFDSYLSVITAQEALYSAEQSLIATRLARLENSVTMYKVLGGGWK